MKSRISLQLIIACVISITSYSQTLDLDFKPKITIPATITDMAFAGDGKVIVVGYFSEFHNTQRRSIVRLNADGTVDESFNANGVGPRESADVASLYNSGIDKVVVMPNGKIVIYGEFRYYNGVPRYRVARLNADGSLDTSFVPPGEEDAYIGATALEVQEDGKVVILRGLHEFDQVQHFYFTSITRLNTDGSIDNTFARAFTVDTNTINDVELLPGGKFIVAGPITLYGGDAVVGRIFRINSNGRLDDTFDVGSGANGVIFDTTPLPNGKIAVAGSFTQFDGHPANGLVVLNSNGSVDESFNTDLTMITNRVNTDASSSIYALISSRITRYNADGSIDKRYFDSNLSTVDEVHKILTMPDGQLWVGGINFSGKPSFAGFNADLTLNKDFNPGAGPQYPATPNDIHKLSDGKLLLVGGFRYYNGMDKGGIVRLNSDLTVDESFNTGTGFDQPYYSSSGVQSDGKLMVFTSSNIFNGQGNYLNNMLRINTDGTVDATMTGSKDQFSAQLEVGDDDRIYAYNNNQSTFSAGTRYDVTRLDVNGMQDESFKAYLPGTVSEIVPLAGGKVLAYGITNDGKYALVRFNNDGTMDDTFNAKIKQDASVIRHMELTADGKIMLYGSIVVISPTYIAVRLLENGDLDETFTLTKLLAGQSVNTGLILNDGSYLVSVNGSLVRFFKDGLKMPVTTQDVVMTFKDLVQLSDSKVVATGVINQFRTDELTVASFNLNGLDPAPLVPANLAASATATSVTLTWSASTNAVIYEIYRSNNGTFEKIGESETTSYTDEGLTQLTSYSYRVRALGTGGFSDFSEVTIDTIVGLEDEVSTHLSVYPNPVSDLLYVSGAQQVELINSTGKKIGVYNGTGDNIAIPTNDLTPGIYLVKATSATGVTIHRIVRN